MNETVKRISWDSENGKYRILVCHFTGDPSPIVSYWIIDPDGKKKDVLYKDLPDYVKQQIEIIKSQVMFNRRVIS